MVIEQLINLMKVVSMASDNIDLEELFRRISSLQTREAFKVLRYATAEDLARAFQPHTESVRTEAQPHCPPAPNDN